MAIETKIKEVKNEEVYPCLYSTEDRSTVILATKDTGSNKFEGVCVHPKNSFGKYSINWSKTNYKRMDRGSELTLKFIQE